MLWYSYHNKEFLSTAIIGKYREMDKETRESLSYEKILKEISSYCYSDPGINRIWEG